MQHLTRESFAPHVGSEFRARSGEREIVLRLREVKALPTATGEVRERQPFALYFLGPADVLVHQQTVPLEHESLGSLGIFLVPVGREADGFLYEAVFG
jgi:hypothetical protein